MAEIFHKDCTGLTLNMNIDHDKFSCRTCTPPVANYIQTQWLLLMLSFASSVLYDTSKSSDCIKIVSRCMCNS